MELIKIKVKRQNIVSDRTTLVSDTENVYHCKFTFDDEWNEYDKWAVFKQDNRIYQIPLVNNECDLVNASVLDEGYMAIGVYGVNGNKRYPTIWTHPVLVKLGVRDGIEPPQPTPSEWELIIQMIAEGKLEGATFIPSVSEEGVISWTNNRDLPNPPSRNIKGPQGNTGNGISSIELVSTQGLNKTYRINYTYGTYYEYVVKDGAKGDKGEKGDTGNGIASTVLNQDYTLTITFTNGTTYTTPSIRGVQGQKGETGDTGNGIQSIELVSTVGTAKTYRINYTNGSHFDYVVYDGETPSLENYYTKSETNTLLNNKADVVDLNETNRNLNNLVKASIGKLIQFTERTYTAFRNLINANAISTTLKEIDGRSVVDNQLANNTNSSVTRNGITFTNNGDGSWTVNGTATADARSNQLFRLPTNRQANKYLLFGCPLGGSNQTYFLGGEYIWIGSKKDTGNGVIINDNIQLEYTDTLFIFIANGTTVNNLVFKPRLVNLTTWFGLGNEPSSLDDTKIEEVKRYLALHPEYNEGTIVNAEVDKVEVVGKNLFNPENWIDSTTLGLNVGYINTFLLEKGKTYALKANESLSRPHLYTYIAALKNGESVNINNVSNATNPYWYTTQWASYFNPKIFTMNETCLCFAYAALDDARYTSKADGQARLKEVQLEEGSTATSYVPYNKFSLDIPQEIQELDGYGLRNNKVDYANKKYIQNDDIRAYQSGDKNEPTYLTDGTNTIYPLTTPIETDISSYLPEYFGQFNVEGNGTITIHNDNELDTTSKFENMEVIQ